MTDTIGPYVYSLKNRLGRGAYSDVYLGRHTSTQEQAAIKVINLSQFAQYEKQLLREVAIMKQVRHKHVIQLFDYYRQTSTDGNDYLYIVMEYCSGGDLESIKTYITPKVWLPMEESHFQIYFKQIMSGLRYLRQQNIIHRDIKPKNILLTGEHSVKIADFTLARVSHVSELMETKCGTPLYMAPEVLAREKYEDSSDIWSLGVILYEYIYGTHPYSHVKDTLELEKFILGVNIQIPAFINSGTLISPSLLHLLSCMLKCPAKTRISWSDLYNHPWIQLKHELNILGKCSPVENINEYSTSAPSSLRTSLLFNKPSTTTTKSKTPLSRQISLLIPPELVPKAKPVLVTSFNESLEELEPKVIIKPEGIKRSEPIQIGRKEIQLDLDYRSGEAMDIPASYIGLGSGSMSEDTSSYNSVTKVLSKSLSLVRNFFSV